MPEQERHQPRQPVSTEAPPHPQVPPAAEGPQQADDLHTEEPDPPADVSYADAVRTPPREAVAPVDTPDGPAGNTPSESGATRLATGKSRSKSAQQRGQPRTGSKARQTRSQSRTGSTSATHQTNLHAWQTNKTPQK